MDIPILIFSLTGLDAGFNGGSWSSNNHIQILEVIKLGNVLD